MAAPVDSVEKVASLAVSEICSNDGDFFDHL
jgi:hypothetical protein